MAAPPSTPQFVCPHCGSPSLNVVTRKVVREESTVDLWNADGTPAETYLHTKEVEQPYIQLCNKDTGEDVAQQYFHCEECGKICDKPVPAPNDPSASEI